MDNKSIVAGGAILSVKRGQWAGLMLRIVGTTGAGAAPVEADFGTITFRRAGGRPQAVVSWVGLQATNEMDFGFMEASIGAAGANPILHTVIVPSTTRADGNIMDILTDENSEIEVSFSGFAAAEWTTGTIYLSGIPSEGVQMYQRQLFEQTLDLTASGIKPLKLTYDNISDLYVVTSTNIAELTLERDGVTIVDDLLGNLQAISNAHNRHEATFSEGLKLELAGSGALTEMLSDDMDLTVRAGSGGAVAAKIISAANDFTPDRLATSSALVAAKTEAKFARKAAANKGRPLSVIRALTNAT